MLSIGKSFTRAAVFDSQYERVAHDAFFEPTHRSKRGDTMIKVAFFFSLKFVFETRGPKSKDIDMQNGRKTLKIRPIARIQTSATSATWRDSLRLLFRRTDIAEIGDVSIEATNVLDYCLYTGGSKAVAERLTPVSSYVLAERPAPRKERIRPGYHSP